jgi:hypothetical protein
MLFTKDLDKFRISDISYYHMRGVELLKFMQVVSNHD